VVSWSAHPVQNAKPHNTVRLQTEVLAKGIKPIRRHYTSISSVLTDLPATDLLVNATGIGSLNLTDILDKNLYPTRGQTILVAEPKMPINRMYEFECSKYGAVLATQNLNSH
jgi:D-amino-acid oxidase